MGNLPQEDSDARPRVSKNARNTLAGMEIE